MRTFSSGGTTPQESLIADMQKLLEIVSNPAEAKKLLAELADAVKEAEKAKAVVAAQSAEMSAMALKLAENEAKAAAFSEQMKKDQAELDAAMKKIAASSEAVRLKETALEKEKAEFNAAKVAQLEAVVLHEKELAAAVKEANGKKEEAEKVLAEYEAKLAKLKAVMGA